MRTRIYIYLFIAILYAAPLFAKSPTLFVVTRSTQKFRIGGHDNPTVGLFSTKDDGKTWRHYGWPYTKCFSVSMTKSGEKHIIYLSCGNGVQKSDDGGKSWKIATGWNITECLKTAIHPGNPEVVYAACAYGIFKTKDGGETWHEKNTGLTSTFTPSIIIDMGNHEVLFCATEEGIHRSTNAGEYWEPVGLLGLGIRTIIQHPQNPERIAVGTEDDGVFISYDHGVTWEQRVDGLTHKTVYALAWAPQDASTIYAGTFQGGIFKSTNGGDSWRAVNNNLKMLDIHALLVDPNDINTVYAGILNDGVWMSDDGGESWRFIGLETSQVWDMMMF